MVCISVCNSVSLYLKSPPTCQSYLIKASALFVLFLNHSVPLLSNLHLVSQKQHKVNIILRWMLESESVECDDRCSIYNNAPNDRILLKKTLSLVELRSGKVKIDNLG